MPAPRSILVAAAFAAALPLAVPAASAQEESWVNTDFSQVDAPTPIPMTGGTLDDEAIRQGLRDLGYEDVGEIEGEPPHVMVGAVYDGRYMPLQVDTETGAVSPIALPDAHVISTTTITKITTVTDELRDLGYSRIEVIGQDEREITTSAWRYGQPVTVHIDLQTGQVTNLEQDATQYVPVVQGMETDQVRMGLEDLGYLNVAELHRQDDGWRGRGSWLGDPVAIRVDGRTGEVRTWLEE